MSALPEALLGAALVLAGVLFDVCLRASDRRK